MTPSQDLPSQRLAPFGSWASPVTPEMLVEQAVGLSDLSLHEGRLYWVESIPSEGGRQALVAASIEGGSPKEVVGAPFSVRTAVHEYGGRCYVVLESGVTFSNWEDQRMWVAPWEGDPHPLTPEPQEPRAVRFADPVTSPSGRWLVAVRETHGPAGVVNDLVAVDLQAPRPTEPLRIAGGHDFYGAPRFDPLGGRLSFLTWDLPDMPWDSTTLWVSQWSDDEPTRLQPERLAGGPGESVTQPRFSPDGVAHWVSDKTGWWNLYNENDGALCPMAAEFAGPDWTLGNRSYDFTPSGRILATWSGASGTQLGLVEQGRAAPFELPLSGFAWVNASGEEAAFAVASSPTQPPAVVRVDLQNREVQQVRASRKVELPQEAISVAERITYETSGGQRAHALFYPPVGVGFAGLPGELPPLVVTIHGGPTSASSDAFNLATQFWTSRGLAVVAVDYRGSSGYGRAYRQALDGQWGVADVEDCAAVVAHLAAQGWVDPARAVIRGGSAGGFTTMAALAFTEAFAAGVSLYGVADLALLAADTHKFESRYLDRLVGPWPERADLYRKRSPIHHLERITDPLLLLQGSEDKVVPPSQSRLAFAALRDLGRPVAYMEFEGEQHGFRRAETIVTVARAELEFYGRILGFEPDTAPVGLELYNFA